MKVYVNWETQKLLNEKEYKEEINRGIERAYLHEVNFETFLNCSYNSFIEVYNDTKDGANIVKAKYHQWLEKDFVAHPESYETWGYFEHEILDK